MRIASTIGASKVAHGGTEYEADENGILEVPEHVGQELTSFPAWLPEHVAAQRAAAAQAEHDTDAVVQARQIAELAVEVAELREQVAALTAAAEDTKAPPKRATKTTD